MKVYVLELGNDYEESHVDAVFKNKPTAENVGEKLKKQYKYDFYIVHEKEVIED